MQKLGFYLLLVVIIICGCVLSAITKDGGYFGGALLVAAFLGFWGMMTSD